MQWWALLFGGDFCVGQIQLPDTVKRPHRRHATMRFTRAVKIDRPGNLMVENIVVDRAAGTGTWEIHEPSAAVVTQRDRRDSRVAEVGFDAWLEERVAELVAIELQKRAAKA